MKGDLAKGHRELLDAAAAAAEAVSSAASSATQPLQQQQQPPSDPTIEISALVEEKKYVPFGLLALSGQSGCSRVEKRECSWMRHMSPVVTSMKVHGSMTRRPLAFHHADQGDSSRFGCLFDASGVRLSRHHV